MMSVRSANKVLRTSISQYKLDRPPGRLILLIASFAILDRRHATPDACLSNACEECAIPDRSNRLPLNVLPGILAWRSGDALPASHAASARSLERVLNQGSRTIDAMDEFSVRQG